MQSAMYEKISKWRILKWIFGGFSIVFVGMLFIMTVHDVMTGEASNPQSIVPNIYHCDNIYLYKL